MGRPATGQTRIMGFRPPARLREEFESVAELEQRTPSDALIEAMHDWIAKKRRERNRQGPAHSSCYHVSYSLTCVEYDDLLRLAAERCMICREAPETLFIDHDHNLGMWAVRGLVCHPCNQHLKCVDAGTREETEAVSRYLANAWHLSQASSSAKQARSRRRVTCPTCGLVTATYKNGALYRHWSRIPGQSDTLCPGGRT